MSNGNPHVKRVLFSDVFFVEPDRVSSRSLKHFGPWMMRTTLICAALCTALAPLSVEARPSRKQLREAERYANLAKDHFRDKKYGLAAEMFMRVYRMSKKVTAVFNAARCKEMAGRLGEARSLFELYLSISDDEAGKSDARDRLVDIARRSEAKRQADKRRQARQAEQAKQATQAKMQAEMATKRAEAARKDAERRVAELDKKHKEAQAIAKRAKSPPKPVREPTVTKLEGVVVMPPTGIHGGDVAIAATAALEIVAAQAAAARIGRVRSVAQFNQVESTRGASGVCDLPCRLALARKLGARWAVGTSFRSKSGRLVLQSVLWRTLDMGQDGVIRVVGTTATALQAGYKDAAGDLFNLIRILPTTPLRLPPSLTPLPAGQVAATVDVITQPDGAELWLDSRAIGRAPRRLQMAGGWHRLQFRLAGHRVRGGLFHVRGNEAVTVTVRLPALRRSKTPPEAARQSVDRRSKLPVSGSSQQLPGAETTQPSHRRPASSPPPAGRRDVERADRRANARSPDQGRERAVSDRTRPSSGAKPVSAPVSKAGVGWLGGLVVHTAGSIGAFDARLGAEKGGPDLSLGAGVLAHYGYANESAPLVPLVSFMTGAKFVSWQGLHGEGSENLELTGPEIFAGVVFPRLWGAMVSVHRHWMGNESNSSQHAFNMWSLGFITCKDWVFSRLAIENRIDSSRPTALDPFGAGPSMRVVLELGISIGDVRLSK